MTLEAEPNPSRVDDSKIDNEYITQARARITDPALQERFDTAITDLRNWAERVANVTGDTRANAGAFFERHANRIKVALRDSGVPATLPRDSEGEDATTIARNISDMYEQAAGYDRQAHMKR